MRPTLLAAFLLLAAPAYAQLSQGQSSMGGAYHAPNLANPQHHNAQIMPPEEHRNLSSGQARAIPTPTLGRATTRIDPAPLPGAH